MTPIRWNQLHVPVLGAVLALAACGGERDSPSFAAQRSNESQPGAALEAEIPGATSGSDATTAGRDADNPLGDPLDQPQRYYGLYANPETPNRQWFVTAAKRPEYAEQAPEIPPGYLMIGAMFGDVAPWAMRSVSETDFEQAWVSDFQPEPVTVAFELDGDRSAIAMTFTSQQVASQGRLERQGDLQEGW